MLPRIIQTPSSFRHRSAVYSTSRIMSFSEVPHDYSLEALGEYAQELINKNMAQELSTRTSVCLAVAGGGGHAISTLAATPGASSILLEGSVTYDRKSYRAYVGLPSSITTDFRYSSHKAAKLASEAALKRALNFRSHSLKLMTGCVGVGCASALVSSSSPGNVKGYGHIVATRADGSTIALNVTLAGRQDNQNRSRVEEDVFISHLVLRVMELVQQAESEGMKIDDMKTEAGDTIAEKWEPSPAILAGEKDAPALAAERLLSGDARAMVLLPMYNKDGKPTSFRALEFPVVPNGSLIFPGSFNPPHKGHISLVNAAIKATMNILDENISTQEPPIFMELSLTNADKAPIDPSDVSHRVNTFLELDNMPEQWGILLTRAPLFSEKVSALVEDCIIDPTEGYFPKMSFVIGTDTMVRILDPKYYGGEESVMQEAVRSMKDVHFCVGGRLEQKKDSSEPPRFVSGAEELEGLPHDIRNMFTIIKEDDFRMDISSSEIRQQKAISA
jgi:nicotinic acid mononucleotide adenylyltransferase/nicotinamide mononucleotide (NMN) deamidase PncC